MQIIKKEDTMKEFISELKKAYGTRNKDKSLIWVAGMVFTSAIIIFALERNQKRADYYLLIYFSCVSLLMAFSFFSFYFYYKMENREKYKKLKHFSTYFFVALLAITLHPVGIIIYILYKLGFVTSLKHIGLYIFPLLISMIVIPFAVFYSYPILLKFSYLNGTCVLITFALFLFMFIFKLTRFIYFKVSIRKSIKHNSGKEESLITEEKLFNKEIYVFSFVMITLVTVIIYLFNFPSSSLISPSAMKEIKDNILYSFAIYLVFDQLHDKWKAANLTK
jgi:hypothetical protein